MDHTSSNKTPNDQMREIPGGFDSVGVFMFFIEKCVLTNVTTR